MYGQFTSGSMNQNESVFTQKPHQVHRAGVRRNARSAGARRGEGRGAGEGRAVVAPAPPAGGTAPLACGILSYKVYIVNAL